MADNPVPPRRPDVAAPVAPLLTAPPTSPPVLSASAPTEAAANLSSSHPDRDQPNAREATRSRNGTKRIWIALGALTVAAVVAGGYFLIERSGSGHNDAEQKLPTLPTDEHTGWIASGRYTIPDEIPPGLYRVGRDFAIRDDGAEIDRQSSVTSEGTTLVVIPPNAAAGTIDIGGGAWPLKENGAVDPTQFQDGTYLVGFDLQPGTYHVTPVTNRVNIAGAGILDERGEVVKAEYLDSSDATLLEDGITIEVESTDFAFYFVGHLERVD